jgi:two-component system, NarL family, nitrate/nitrite response regulator NarL
VDSYEIGPDVRIAVHCGRRLLCDALTETLGTVADFTVVGNARNSEALLSLVELALPDIVLLDAKPGTAWTVRTIRTRFPSIRPAVMYEKLTPAEIAELREAGVQALVPLTNGLPYLLATLRRLAAQPLAQPRSGTGLTAREQEILALTNSAYTVGQIAEMLSISVATVQNHKRKLYAKLASNTAAEPRSAAPVEPVNTPNPDPGRSLEDGRPTLAVVRGRPGLALERVRQTLISQQVPMACELAERDGTESHWLRWHRGPITTVLVDPAPSHWPVVRSNRQQILVVRSGRLDRAAVIGDLSKGAGAVIEADRMDGQLVPALQLVGEGCLVVGGSQARPLARAVVSHSAEQTARLPELTARERDILHSIALGHTVRQTARTLGISLKTVENTQAHLFSKLRVHNRAGALTTAYSLGLISPADTAESGTSQLG